MKISKPACFAAFVLMLVFSTASAQDIKGRLPFYAVPYYNSDPLTISIGKYKTELLTEDTTKILALANKIKADLNNTDIESLLFLSLRLYDLGKKDESFYWFHTAKARAIVFIDMLDTAYVGGIGSQAFELKTFFGTFSQLVGGYINAHGFNDFDRGVAVFEKVKGEIKNIGSFKNLYPNIHFLDDNKLEEEKMVTEENLGKAITYFKANKEELMKKRIGRGIQGK
ncbi:MAG: hypothetical protein Q8916_13105 [Bacteroidota bacterium]|nr:hypothetical protein [Bacteroidota bacterium]MDP4231330.1 hypothetical protein [Bacteroidota bacterium]